MREREREREREGEKKKKERNPSFFPRSTKFRQSEFVGLRTKVYHLYEGYAYIPKMNDFTKDPEDEISRNQGFQAMEASYPCYYISRGRGSSYFGLFSTLKGVWLCFFP